MIRKDKDKVNLTLVIFNLRKNFEWWIIWVHNKFPSLNFHNNNTTNKRRSLTWRKSKKSKKSWTFLTLNPWFQSKNLKLPAWKNSINHMITKHNRNNCTKALSIIFNKKNKTFRNKTFLKPSLWEWVTHMNHLTRISQCQRQVLKIVLKKIKLHIWLEERIYHK